VSNPGKERGFVNKYDELSNSFGLLSILKFFAAILNLVNFMATKKVVVVGSGIRDPESGMNIPNPQYFQKRNKICSYKSDILKTLLSLIWTF